MLYECLTGNPPFFANHAASVLVRILFEDPAPLEKHRQGAPGSLTALLRQMLQKHLASRLPDAGALQTVLGALGELLAASAPHVVADPAESLSLFGEHQQGLFTVSSAASPGDMQADDRPASFSTVWSDETERVWLHNMVQRLGGSVELLANGALLVTMPQLR